MSRFVMYIMIGALLATAVTGLASARETASASDPDDTRGRLDLRYVSFERSGKRITLTLRTAEKWRCRLLKDDTSSAQGAAEAYEDGKAAFLLWSFDSDRDNNVDHSGFFRCKDPRMQTCAPQERLVYVPDGYVPPSEPFS